MKNKILEEGIRSYWTRIAKEMLIGRQIHSVSYLSSEECDEMDWHNAPLAIGLSNRLYNQGETPIWIYPSMDDEGNGAGSLFTSSDENPILPVISKDL